MKVLVFHIGDARYALPLAAIGRVLPVAGLRPLPGAPDFVRGLLDLHGEAIPVIDLSSLAGRTPEAVRYDTRFLLVEVPAAGRMRRLALKAERVSGVSTVEGPLAQAGVACAPWLGPIAAAAPASPAGGAEAHTERMLQLLDPARLLAPEVEALLFGAQAGAA